VSLRTRLTLAGGGAVFVALAIASLVIYVEVRSKLHDQIDFSLIQSAEDVAAKWHDANGPLTLPSAKTGSKGKRPAGTFRGPRNPKSSNAALLFGKDASGFFQVIPSFGAVTNGGLSGFVPLVGRDGSVASGLSPPYFRDVRFAGVTMRLYTMRLPSSSDGLVRTLRPLTEANATIARVRWLLLSLTLGGALAAGLLGRLAANAVLRPVRALAGTVREVSATRDLNQRIAVSGRDELASLAADFNAMLAALDESQHAQQQLMRFVTDTVVSLKVASSRLA
jgi:two-component system, OmpR family, sensor histidine kinase MprB